MLVVIMYNTDFKSQAISLKEEIKEEWEDVHINMIGISDHIGGAKYQVQLGTSVVSRSDSPVDNTTIINLIKERL
tara:strand:+ start:1988 stop:2212 length:225 start_codon:yes stop_codon:yes gene_type:complete